MKALVFGSNGQDGHYLLELLRQEHIEGIGVSRSGTGRHADVSKLADVEALVREVRPAYIFHLAASSTTRHEAGLENHDTIATGTLNILESAYRHAPAARVFITGSGVQFRNTGVDIDEETPFEPSSLYSVARIQAVFAARYYRSLGVRTFVGYLFHHESPRRPPGHVSRMTSLAAHRIGLGSAETVALGDTSVVKEWTFAGDTMRAALMLARQDEIAEAVIGSGEGHSIEEWVELCFRLAGRHARDHVTRIEGFRPEYPRLVSRPTRIKSLGWAPTVTFEDLAAMMMRAAR
jgi:GDPmannose 4,6-dehydratase